MIGFFQPLIVVCFERSRVSSPSGAGLVIVDSGPDLDTRGTTRIRMEAESAELVFEFQIQQRLGS